MFIVHMYLYKCQICLEHQNLGMNYQEVHPIIYSFLSVFIFHFSTLTSKSYFFFCVKIAA